MTYTEITPELTRSDDLAVGVHCRGRAGATEGAEIDHPACRRPGEGMGTACDGAPADDLSSIVQCESYPPSENAQPPEGTETDDRATELPAVPPHSVGRRRPTSPSVSTAPAPLPGPPRVPRSIIPPAAVH